jgi:hypothetical protein
MIKIRKGPKIDYWKIISTNKLFDDDRLILTITAEEIVISRSSLDDDHKANSVFEHPMGRCLTKTSEYLREGDYLIDMEESDEDNLVIPLL